MSHFSCMIIGENPKEQLAPFSETDEKYQSFVDKTEEVLKEYETETTLEFYCASSSSWGMHIEKEFYDKLEASEIGEQMDVAVGKIEPFQYYTKGKRYEGYHTIEGGKRCEGSQWFKVVTVLETTHPDKDTCFDGKIRIEKIAAPKDIPVKDKYKNVDDFAENYSGYKKNENGRYGYYSNENAKWDWFSLGGRFNGYLKLKHGATGKVGEPGLQTDPVKEGYADSARNGDIEFEGMMQEQFERASKTYDEFEELLKSDPEKAKNSAYFEFGVNNTSEDFDHWKPQSREEYLYDHASVSAFAVIKDGKFYEKGKMGWWGIVHNEKDGKDWNEELKKLIADLPDDTLISIYDLHI